MASLIWIAAVATLLRNDGISNVIASCYSEAIQTSILIVPECS
ncbi:MAG: hypothetical protein WCL30_03025 [Pseudomonadota bacterium]